MHAAPPVLLVCRPGRGWSLAHHALQALAAGVLALWSAQWLALPGPAGAAAVLAVVALAGKFSRLDPDRPLGTLGWDGQGWALDGCPGRTEVMLDLGVALLLRFRAADGTAVRWLPLGPGSSSAQRQLLRAALYGTGPHAATLR